MNDPEQMLPVNLPTLKLYCPSSACRRVEAHNPFSDWNLVDTKTYGSHSAKGMRIQLFVVGNECQSCKGLPVVFSVKRDGPKLTLVGRDPFEMVDVPSYIPKWVEQYFSKSIVAQQTGQ
jgi:hypothetical protein